ncbi:MULTISPECIES: 23S rRNA (uracil(1939)-C(5))-methyltransferase RlmD [unclassified Adlercreutzia]|uniref:23S rRNA (uracil(1939)-C(5))-methyltransferase RlmD n=1 Tax=unclassified Adlercreutzia TaxID=2636013 RepID=UPI0013EB753C|nr:MULTISPECIES: 23S rRNA (uracil(1939)-C(5))-methyltransferase RlmD [unclassified Adlercreutzia]
MEKKNASQRTSKRPAASAKGDKPKPKRAKAASGGGKHAKPQPAKGKVPKAGAGKSGAKAAKSGPAKAQAQAKAPGCKLCAVFGRCGGCSLLDMPYRAQLIEKQQLVIDLFAPLADLTALRPILGMDDPFHYRNKVVSPYAPGRKAAAPPRRGKPAARPQAHREILTGMYAKGTHQLIPADTCALENETAKAITLVVRDLMRRWDIAPYDEDTGEGFMRHCVVRVGHSSGEVLVTLVTNDDEFPSSKSFCRELVRRAPAVTTVVQNVNTRQTNVILGEKERVLFGSGFILDELCGLSFRISSHSFYQVNAAQTEVLYREAVALADLRGSETVIDAYCGTGTIGLVAARAGAGRVIGVDNVESAIRDAQQNARHNRIDNAEFMALDASAFMAALAVKRAGDEREGDAASAGSFGAAPADAPADAPVAGVPASAPAADAPADDLVVMMDPPRAGSTERFLDAAVRLAPSRIVYISCNPASQARDVAYLVERGYRVEVVRPVDMFPHTDHVECICKLVRAKG